MYAVWANDSFKGYDLPLLQHSRTAMLFVTANEHASCAWVNRNDPRVVQGLQGSGVRKVRVQLEDLSDRAKVADDLVLCTVGFMVWNAAASQAQPADTDVHGVLEAVWTYSLAKGRPAV